MLNDYYYLNVDRLLNIADNFILEHDMKKYVSKVVFNNRERPHDMGYYDPNTREVVINNATPEVLSDDSYELSNTFVMFHELTHAYQFKIIESNESNRTLRRMYIHSFEAQDIDELNYMQYHDLYLTEHNADATAAIETINFLELSSVKKVCLFARVLLKDYKLPIFDSRTIAPAEVFYKKCRKDVTNADYILYKNEFDNYTRLCNGLPVSIDAYNYTSKIAKGRVKVKSIDTFINGVNNV